MVLRSALLALSLLASVSAHAAYTRASSAPVTIANIYTNEWGSPFVTFTTTVNTACYGGTGLYLYDITVGSPNTQLRQNKMAVLLMAKATEKRVVLDYFYDGALTANWDACYIQGINIVD